MARTIDTSKLPTRLHHTAYVTKDQAATRAFYEDILGFPLLATWSEQDELFGAVRTYCHTFFGLGDGSALAFFQFADPEDQKLFDPDLAPSPFRHIALNVTDEVQADLARRLEEANWNPEATFVLAAMGDGECWALSRGEAMTRAISCSARASAARSAMARPRSERLKSGRRP